MHLFGYLISEEITYALGWTVLHSLWQGVLIATALWIVMAQLPAASSRARYQFSLGALFLMLITTIGTFSYIYSQSNFEEAQMVKYFIYSEGIARATDLSAHPVEGNSWNTAFYAFLNNHLYYIVSAWLVGMLVFILRFLCGLGYVFHLRSGAMAIREDYWKERINKLSHKMGVRSTIKLAESVLVKTPMVIGHLKPLILLPVGTINALSPREVEAILSHEMAHIVRNDYLINLIQSCIELIFYYHPAVWWISSIVRREREANCDDIAVSVCGNSLEYAKALVSLQETHQYSSPAFGMSFSGHKNQFLFRIRRILNQSQKKSNFMERLMASGILLFFIVLLSIQAKPSDKNRDMIRQSEESLFHFEAKPDQLVRHVEFSIDTIIPKSSEKEVIVIRRKEKDEEVEMKMEDGKITELKVNGETIPEEEYEKHRSRTREMLRTLPPAPPAPPAPAVEGSVPLPPAPPETPAPFFFNKKGVSVKMDKDDDGNTILWIDGEEDGDSPTRLIVEDGKVLMFSNDGEVETEEIIELKEGETIIIEKEDDHSFFFEQGEGGKLFFSAPEIEIATDAFFSEDFDFDFDEEVDMKELRQELEALKSEMNEEKLAEVKAMMERAREMTDQKRELIQRQRELAAREREEVQKHVEIARARAEKYQERVVEAEERALARVRVMEECKEKADAEAMEKTVVRGFHLWTQAEKGSSHMQRTFENALLEDGLIDSRDNYKLELDAKRLKVNNKKQSVELHEKYVQLYERTTGKDFSEKNKITIEVKSEEK
jgi:bla regulator protein BlaR1